MKHTITLLTLFVAAHAVAALALACGSSPVSVGIEDDAGVRFTTQGDGSLPAPGLTVTVVPDRVDVCPGHCVDLTANATGGAPPYTYQWGDEPDAGGPTFHLCPAETTVLAVTASDSSGHAGEIAARVLKGTAQATVTVSDACTDGSAEPGEAGPPEVCDSVASQFSTTGANPSGPWAFGETMGLGGAFTRFDTFVNNGWSADGGLSVMGWQLGVINTPSVGYNAQAVPTVYEQCPIGVGRFAELTDEIFDKLPIARWTAAAAGTYRARATFDGTCSGGAAAEVEVHILKNGAVARSAYLNEDGGGPTASLELDVDAAAGDTIDFTLEGSFQGGSSSWMALVDARVCRPTGDGG